VALPALATLVICMWQLHLPNSLFGVHEYDDGVYIGAALRLVSGVVPYRDFVIVHPPGIVLLMSPVALLGRWLGTNVALAGAREITALVAAANVALAGFAVRHRGRRAALVAATGMACFPMSPAADSTLFLEPYLVAFLLVGVIAMFHEGRLASPRRLLLAGVLFGLAGTVKVWAVFVAVAAVLVALRRWRTAALPLVIGGLAGVTVPCLPFLLMAPHRFLRDVIGDQLERVVTGASVFSWGERVLWVTGMAGLTAFRAGDGVAVVAAALGVALVGVCLWRGRAGLQPADAMALLAAGGAVAALCFPNELYAHYVYFPAPFLAMVAGVAVSAGLGSGLPGPARRVDLAVVGACLLAGALLLPQQVGYARSHLAVAKDPTALNLVLSRDTCIVSDDAVVEISADLFVPRRAGCPAVLDPFGTWLADGPAYEPSYGDGQLVHGVYRLKFPAPFVDEWGRWLDEADYVVQLAPQGGYIPWTPALRAWFFANFKLVPSPSSSAWIYKHVGHQAPPPAP
jgi:alpha-1,2-mannosyltransferase